MKKKPEEKPVADEVIETTVEATTKEAVAEETAAKEPKEKSIRPVTRRYNKRGTRRGKYAYAAPLGMLISLLAVIGVVALVFVGIGAIQKLTDTSALEEEFDHFLEPVMAYIPAPFEDINTAEQQDAFLLAATNRITLQEQIRMTLEKDETAQFPYDDMGRIAVPADQVAASYAALFGAGAPLTHRTLADHNVTYSEVEGCYYLPFDSLYKGYEGVVESVKRKRGDYLVRVAYVNTNDIRLDKYGEPLPADPADATSFQVFTLGANDDGTYYIKACENETVETAK